jgi:hypothetical protein
MDEQARACRRSRRLSSGFCRDQSAHGRKLHVLRITRSRRKDVGLRRYNLPQPPPAVERNAEYAAKLRSVGQKVGLPANYIDSLG